MDCASYHAIYMSVAYTS